ncbi:hypothetical protein CD932_08710 [Janthinobacterium sp. PC23-8]|nr:hypothetical protein CD932_08710 [Janthinobacterium sp. PC23-8]
MMLLLLNALMLTMPWGSIYLSLIIAITYMMYRPQHVLHPNNMIFAFYGLYVILSSTLNLILYAIHWEYVLPWGQLIFWDLISKKTLFQAEFTFLILYFSFYQFTKVPQSIVSAPPRSVVIKPLILTLLYIWTWVLALWFIQVTAGFPAWINDYSATYLSMREGHGLLNVITIVFGNITVFLLGLKTYYSKNKRWIIVAALLVMMPLSFIAGIKSRFIFLLVIFLSPYFMRMVFSIKYLAIFSFSFFILLYLGTLIRTEGFYASAPFFLEMLIGYFNSFQLHDSIVISRDPGLLQTVFQIFTKPLQTLGFITDLDANFDISVMLTKEFFPDQWYLEHATQQWPLDTELYLNYYGIYLSWLPLLVYTYCVSMLYRHAVLKRNYNLVPIFVMEFQRIFSTMRGTLVPWEVFIYVVQYLLIYVFCRLAIKVGPVAAKVQNAEVKVS